MLNVFDVFAIGLGIQEIMIIAGVAVLLFGGSKIPQLMRGMGQGIKEFRNAANEATNFNTSSPVGVNPSLASLTDANPALEAK